MPKTKVLSRMSEKQLRDFLQDDLGALLFKSTDGFVRWCDYDDGFVTVEHTLHDVRRIDISECGTLFAVTTKVVDAVGRMLADYADADDATNGKGARP